MLALAYKINANALHAFFAFALSTFICVYVRVSVRARARVCVRVCVNLIWLFHMNDSRSFYLFILIN